MSYNDSQLQKGTVDESQEDAIVGSSILREAPADTVSDNINGTISLSKKGIERIGIGPNDYIKIEITAPNGNELTTTLQMHRNGRTTVLPKRERRRLGLNPGDEIDYRITLDEKTPPDMDSDNQKSISPNESEIPGKYVIFKDDPFNYHYLNPDNHDETACGLSLTDTKYKTGSDPGDIPELCSDCAARSPVEMTKAQILEWLADESRADFQPDSEQTGYLNNDQLQSIMKGWVELEDRIKDQEAQIQELQSKLGEYQ